MGRIAKRVPLDFAAPLDEIWPGYLRNECGLAYDNPDDEAVDAHLDSGGCEGCRNIDPPTGPGWQLWETTTEGSPQSPVFATLEELAAWCESHATTFGSWTATKDEWLAMLAEDDVHHDEGHIRFI